MRWSRRKAVTPVHLYLFTFLRSAAARQSDRPALVRRVIQLRACRPSERFIVIVVVVVVVGTRLVLVVRLASSVGGGKILLFSSVFFYPCLPLRVPTEERVVHVWRSRARRGFSRLVANVLIVLILRIRVCSVYPLRFRRSVDKTRLTVTFKCDRAPRTPDRRTCFDVNRVMSDFVVSETCNR